ncbi:origin recognition complex subunit 4 C-terminus-domain-containing protein [Aspergillus filifer]
MDDPRTAKRRRVSDTAAAQDEDGDMSMQDAAAATPLKDEAAAATATHTPATGTRSSGRQRKAPERYEDQPGEIQRTRSVRKAKAAATPKGTPKGAVSASATKTGSTSKPAGSARGSRRKSSTVPVEPEMEDGDGDGDGDGDHAADDNEDLEFEDGSASPQPAKRPMRTRSKRTSVRFSGAGNYETADVNGDADADADDFQDGLDDLVGMQLQQDLVRDYPSGKDEATAGEDQAPLPDYAEQFQQFIRSGYEKEVQLLTKIVAEKLNGKRLVPLKGLDVEHHKVHQLIRQTVSVGEGNSMLLLGSRGSGKTAIIETIVSTLRKQHKNDFHVVRLNGFLHTDDRLALREIWRQLGRETATEEEAGKVTSYADTMATLLAMLSHPEELNGPNGSRDGTTTTAKSIIIVLDEFDLFVTHPRQTLLYNLFDIAQARKAPIAVLGVTTKVDVTAMLEKRVKSRFSHRSVYVPLPRTFEVFSDACLAGLDLDQDQEFDLEDETRTPAGTGVALSADDQSIAKSDSWMAALDGWRVYLQGLWADPAFQTHLRRIYHQTKSVKEFFTSALMAVTELHHSTAALASPVPHDNPQLQLSIPTPSTFTSNPLTCPDPAPLPFFPSQSHSSSSNSRSSSPPTSLPLSLLLAATRLTALYDPGTDLSNAADLAPLALSFPAAYAEYVRLLTTAKTSASVSGASVTPGRVWGRNVAREAWERLVTWGLVSPVGGGSGTADGRMFRVEIAFEEVVALLGRDGGGSGGLGKWWRDA